MVSRATVCGSVAEIYRGVCVEIHNVGCIVSTRYVPALLPNHPRETGLDFFISLNILIFFISLFLFEA
jgi:hypothetical protein